MNTTVKKRDNTQPAFTPRKSELPHSERPQPKVPVERRSIILDTVHPKDFLKLNLIYCCEQCSYFNVEKKTCAMGFVVAKHMRESQLELYSRTGKMAFCRSQEID